MELYASAQDKGMQFSNGFVDDNKDVINTFKIVEATSDQINKECTEATSKPNKRALPKKATPHLVHRSLEIRQPQPESHLSPSGRALAPIESRRHPKQKFWTQNILGYGDPPSKQTHVED